jgi:hypothetical protein
MGKRRILNGIIDQKIRLLLSFSRNPDTWGEKSKTSVWPLGSFPEIGSFD